MPGWYYQVMGETKGPVSTPALRDLVASGTVTRETFVRDGHEADWVLADSLYWLFPAQPTRVDDSAAFAPSGFSESQESEKHPVPMDVHTVKLDVGERHGWLKEVCEISCDVVLKLGVFAVGAAFLIALYFIFVGQLLLAAITFGAGISLGVQLLAVPVALLLLIEIERNTRR